MSSWKNLVWLRNDLRLHDNEALTAALSSSPDTLLVYCLDERLLGTLPSGFPKMGKFRAKFLLESLADLREQVRQKGGELIFRIGKPEEIVPELAKVAGVSFVYFHREVTSEELRVEAALRKNLQAIGIQTKEYWGSTLYHLNDLPMSIEHLPDVFTQFRKECEKRATVRATFPAPKSLRKPTSIEVGALPTLEQLGIQPPQPEPRAAFYFKGGEREGLRRLEEYFWQKDLLRNYKETRNGLIGADYSSKFSAWLALGCLSPRKIYEEIKRYEAKRIANDSTYWLIFELIWRDFFRFVALKYGNRLFHKFGIKGQPKKWSRDRVLFQRWVEGRTGQPFIDANMRELAATGFMSNRGRQNVASYLVHYLQIDWRLGAEYFESMLVDYDVCSNYGNWNYVAGIGNDPRENRVFNPVRQAEMYDPEAAFIKLWIPELRNIPARQILTAERLSYS
ncbi:MAG: DASH family cryptochrome [Chloroherpetonaceae bacterium]|nr:DASH family cryptochrome [Chloroherpetonaceae bacterium]MCS7210128.1 DASH family cryptochrome [Chloroherpetonaceae bacterium]MDW8019880.1 DASH family cryptochrome [Chloroherpetonaceae bacterium]